MVEIMTHGSKPKSKRMKAQVVAFVQDKVLFYSLVFFSISWIPAYKIFLLWDNSSHSDVEVENPSSNETGYESSISPGFSTYRAKVPRKSAPSLPSMTR